MILAFCLSVLVGLLLGALVYILLTWASRRRATAMITRRSKKRSRTSHTNSPLGGQIGLYRSTFLSVYRQPSLEPVGPLGSKPNLETSTFRPVPKRSRAPLDMGEDTQINVAEDTAASNTSDSESLVPNKRHSFWLGSNGLKGFLTSPTPPPAYDSVIRAFEETCTWNCLQKYDKNWVKKGLEHRKIDWTVCWNHTYFLHKSNLLSNQFKRWNSAQIYTLQNAPHCFAFWKTGISSHVGFISLNRSLSKMQQRGRKGILHVSKRGQLPDLTIKNQWRSLSLYAFLWFCATLKPSKLTKKAKWV